MAGAWDVIAGALGFGGPSGNDHGSSNWAAWGHEEICSMLRSTVDPGDIHDAARAWREQGRRADDLVTGLAQDLNGIVAGGWRGASADQALGALGPITHWSASQTEVAARTTELMDSSGTATAQTKTLMPPPVPHDWRRSLGSFMAGGVPGAVIDAVAQDKAQSEAHGQAVRVMTDVYSIPLRDYGTGIPAHLQMADPTVAQPDPSPMAGQVPGAGYPAAVIAGGSVAAGALSGAGTHGAAHGGSAPPASAVLQGIASGEPTSDGGERTPPPSRPGQHPGGQAVGAIAATATAAGVPVVAPVATGALRRARPGGTGIPMGGGALDAANATHGTRAAHIAEFGPRPSAVTEAAEGRMGGNPGHAATGIAGSRGGLSAVPIGAGSGRPDDDAEHQRPSYLIEMDDVFTDGRKVAPAVIGEDSCDGRRGAGPLPSQ